MHSRDALLEIYFADAWHDRAGIAEEHDRE
jgi:hypothetical protein